MDTAKPFVYAAVHSATMQSPQDIVERLSRYRNVLLRLRSLGFARVFSDNLSDALGISASQVRRDLAAFNMRGAKRGGYPLATLLEQLDLLLGVSTTLNVIIVGCGNIGTALLTTYGKRREGVCVVAAFDIRAEVLAPDAEVPILDVRDMDTYITREKIEVAILTVPEQAAPRLMDRLAAAGIRGVLNFTPAQIRGTPDCIVQNLNIRLEIEKLFYLVHFTRHNPL